jgi:hypothetical protein
MINNGSPDGLTPMPQGAHPICVRVASRRACTTARNVRSPREEAAVLVIDHDVAGAVDAMAFHATARLEQVIAAFELAFDRRECRLQRRQLHDAVELALSKRADDASSRCDDDDEPREDSRLRS